MSDKSGNPAAPTPLNHPGRIDGIFVATERSQATTSLIEVRVFTGRGLEGDRYFHGRGSFSRWPGGGRAVSLIAAEAIEAILAEHEIDLSGGRSRRNFVTRGIPLEHLIGKRFRIGTALFYGDRACSPCRYLERLVAPGLYDAIKGRGGLRADLLSDGIVRVGDEIEPLLMSRSDTAAR